MFVTSLLRLVTSSVISTLSGFNRNDYRSPLESDNKDKSGTHITSGLQLFEPDEFFVLDKKSDYTEMIKSRLPQEEPDNDDDLDLPF